MKTTRLFFMAALALMTAACSNDDNEIAQQPQKARGITITAQLAPKTGGATTRAVEDKTTYIEAKWAVDEHIAVLYEVSSTKYVADARITNVDGTTGVATITFTVQEGTPDNTACTLVYPLSAAKDDHSGVKDAATLLAAQDGTLNANLDVRVGEGTIQTTTPGLTVSTQPAAQFAIFKFTVKNSDGSANINVKPLTVAIGSQAYVITPVLATSELYAALPAVSSQAVSFYASGSKAYSCSKASVSFSAGNYYQSTLKMVDVPLNITTPVVDQVIGSDGKNYAYANLPTGVTAVAKICYVSGSNGLALALANEYNAIWSTAVTNCAAHKPAFTGGTWKLATKVDWENMISAAGGFASLSNGFSSVGGKNLASNYYWSSTEDDSDKTLVWTIYNDGNWSQFNKTLNILPSRACLVF